jgi:hypothetical protein
MRATLALRPLIKNSIDSDIASRTHAHQARVAKLKSARVHPSSQPDSGVGGPLVLLAHGDSWFDYPLNGNDLALHSTDIITQLQSLGDTHPLILNLSHYGDATSEEMSLTRQQRLIKAIDDKANWANESAPYAILFSGGGNDIPGTQFCIFLDYDRGLNTPRFLGVLDMVRRLTSTSSLFATPTPPAFPSSATVTTSPSPTAAILHVSVPGSSPRSSSPATRPTAPPSSITPSATSGKCS